MIQTLTSFYLRHEKTVLILAVGTFFVVGYLGIALHTDGLEALAPVTALDGAIPYVPGVWPFYQAVYLLVFIPTRLYSRPAEMRRGAAANAACMAAAYAVFLLYPVHDPAPPAGNDLSDGLALAAGNFAALFDDRGMNCFPSLHLALATIAALCCGRADRRLGIAAWIITGLIGVASLLLKRHYLVDLPAGIALGAVMYALFLRGRLGRPWRGQVAAGAIALALLLVSAPAGAALAAADRPVVLAGRAMVSVLGEPIASLRLLVWEGSGWSPIPYQIDPRIPIERPGRRTQFIHLLGAPGRSDPAHTRVFSAADELIFMAEDLGPRPPGGVGPPGSRAGTLLAVGDRGFAGLFAFASPPPRSERRYVRYDAGADAIAARSYTLAFSKAHPIIFDTLRIHPPGADLEDATPANLVDRMKIRLRGRILGAIPYRKNETDFRSVRDGVRAGPVRVVRACIHRLPALPGLGTPEVREEQFLYADGFAFPLWFTKASGMGRFLSRISLRVGPDWSPAARGMRVHVPGSSAPFTVDGRMDAHERAFRGEGAAWSVIEDGRGALISRIAAVPGGHGASAPFRLRYRDDLDETDPPERYPGQMGALAFEFPEIGNFPAGAHHWVVRTRILPRFTPGAEAEALAAMDSITTARATAVSIAAVPPGQTPRSAP